MNGRLQGCVTVLRTKRSARSNTEQCSLGAVMQLVRQGSSVESEGHVTL